MELKMIYCLFGSKEEAKSVAKTLLREKLIACANIWDRVSSIYIWDGREEESDETIAIFKLQASTVEAAKRRIEELHSYECPCIILLDPEHVNQPYAQWLHEQQL